MDRNFYENNDQPTYEAAELPAGSRPAVKPRNAVNVQNDTEVEVKKRSSKSKPLVLVCLILICLLLVAILVVILIKLQTSSPASALSVSAAIETAASCQDWKSRGHENSGIYRIKNPDANAPYQVYCDMTTDGGGWNLVASVHEYDVYDKCSINHVRWSNVKLNRNYRNYGYYVEGNPLALGHKIGTENWHNNQTFGSIKNATSDDYKSTAYFQTPASDIMVMHVPNKTPLKELEEDSFLKYHTNNSFLSKHGSTLASFFKNDASLDSLSYVGADMVMTKRLKAKPPTASIKNYKAYNFDDKVITSRPNGNEISFSINDGTFRQIQWDQIYTDSRTYHISCAKVEPFILLGTLSNLYDYISNFKLRVSLFAANDGGFSVRSSSFATNLFRVQVRSHHHYSSSSKEAIATVYFTANPAAQYYSYFSLITYNLRNNQRNMTSLARFYTLNREPGLLFGATLLTRKNANTSFTADEIDAFVREILSTADNVRTFRKGISFVHPIVFDKKANVSWSYPAGVSFGFLQLRAYDVFGFTYAMCPAVRLSDSDDPSLYCIGSSNTQAPRCGDFSAWNKLPEHVSYNRNQDPSGKFVNDIASTILIFTR